MGRKLLVSACLLGVPCKYSGGANPCASLLRDIEEGRIDPVPVCPESYGGLPAPREPSERSGDRVLSKSGQDVTAQYEKGAQSTLRIARVCGATGAILKANSPSCGTGRIYDGTFSHTLTDGDGVTAQLLREQGYELADETDYARLLTEGGIQA